MLRAASSTPIAGQQSQALSGVLRDIFALKKAFANLLSGSLRCYSCDRFLGGSQYCPRRLLALVLVWSADVMRLSGGLLRLLPLAGGSASRSAACSGQPTWASCLAAGVSHSLLQQPQACFHSALHPHTQPVPAISLQCFSLRRQFFSLPGSPDLSKHYKERRLIG